MKMTFSGLAILLFASLVLAQDQPGTAGAPRVRRDRYQI
jgi:hypothetical protein